MSRTRRKKRKPLPIKQVLCSAAAVLAALFVLLLLNEAIGGLPLPGMQDILNRLDGLYESAGLSPAAVTRAEGELAVHYVDVGQADCELIQTPEQTVLIDAGDVGGGDAVAAYLKAQDVERIDLLIATHPHADHIGGMADVVNQFEIGKVLFAETPKSLTPTSKTYERLLDAIADKELKVAKAQPGIKYDLGGGAILTVLGPMDEYRDDLNENSVVCRLDFGETAFLFTGDASRQSENDLVKAYGDGLSADVLKLGHHGSDTSSQEKWLNAVDPEIAVCCVGWDNSYGHPSPKVLERLEKRGVTLYRTDRSGTVVVTSDGEQLSVQTEK
ncbi:ComEC/Rec2 family competence protein [uncultured Anaerotruncus sp.]|mgnify:CR=1 FL=1|uniref:ComEC/Rec2 family competence protein n=1 Tax=uncultured Anaerotruncus sp. TaxID=905011 RepID=UPI00280BCC5C|nr:ComEC/Rec2 family competence protein [uncultured Anaerotruncus sp.]